MPSWSPALELADYLGIRPRYVDSTDVGGSSFEFQVASADMAIAAGLCTTAVITYANTPRQDRRIAQPPRPDRRRAASAQEYGQCSPHGPGPGQDER